MYAACSRINDVLPPFLPHVSARPLLRSAATATTATLTLRPMHAHVRWYSFVFVCTPELLVPKSIDRCGVKTACVLSCIPCSLIWAPHSFDCLLVCACVCSGVTCGALSLPNGQLDGSCGGTFGLCITRAHTRTRTRTHTHTRTCTRTCTHTHAHAHTHTHTHTHTHILTLAPRCLVPKGEQRSLRCCGRR